MAIPLKYNIRNLSVRKVSTGMTVFVIALVVMVFLLVMSLAEGIKKTLTKNVTDRDVIVMRTGAQSELQSFVQPQQFETLRTLPGVERNAHGEAMASPELVVLINVAKRDGKKTNVQVRGVLPAALEVRPGIRIVEGRMFGPGTAEAIVPKSVRDRFEGAQIGGTIAAGSERWTVVGVFDAGSTPYDSEIWVDLHNLQGQSKRGSGYSSVTLRAADSAARDRIIASVKGDQRVKLEGKTEKKYYEEQMSTAAPIKILAYLVGIIMAIGASFGAMNTMYAQVSARTREIGTLRALGFSRRSVLGSFVAESLALSAIGGVVGTFFAWGFVKIFLTGPVGTQNFRTFSDILFNFTLTPALLAGGVVFSLAMGLFGGFFPAFRAARLKIVSALREI
ncbi:MAG TPA: ABC transporter permease [Thermoanaerobaculia bacterium]|jgi:putative ABC transport system permease protein|nr:ABC transporter permease [Thermoanaerobaculia bacterium]